MTPEEAGRERPTNGGAGSQAPSITPPKGGGAIRGIGEKFSANPVTGTGSMTVPIATSPGRSDLGPQLSLSYDSGSGNGPFGFGWGLSLPAVTRKTDKGLPQYRDAEESDVFLLSGAEDLVPVFKKEPNGEWELDADARHVIDEESRDGYLVRRYRPRIEGLFARIERWTRSDGDVHWRSISKDNILTTYGKNEESRIVDPADSSRVFSWLICETRDDKGNAVVYEYKEENDDDVDRALANERNRVRTANRYLKRILYGNRGPLLDEEGHRPRILTQEVPDEAGWLFEVAFDYDDGRYEELVLDPSRPPAEQHRYVRASASSGQSWSMRPDPFSAYRAGFEVRTYRRCHRVLMFHRFDELGEEPYLVRSTEFDYADLDLTDDPTVEAELDHQGSTRFASFICSVTQSGYVRDETQPPVEHDSATYFIYLKSSLPPLTFKYSKPGTEEDPGIQDAVHELDAESLENLPSGLDGGRYQLVDLDGEGLSGVLTEQAEAWFYKPNLGGGRFGSQRRVARKPSLAAVSQGRQQFLDLAGDGQLDLAELEGPTPGFYERNDGEDWENFRPFGSLPNLPWDDPNLRFVDLTGDGHADVLITEDEALTWYPSLAEEGFGPSQRVRQALDEETSPRLVLADGTQSIYLADLSGDGLTDLVRIRNGEVCYWPDLGYGRFGPKVTMDNAPWFDAPDQFDQRRIRLADIDGSGTTDIIYLGRDGVRLYFNQSGNRWSAPHHLEQFPPADNLASVMAVDLLGNGTAYLVWSSPLPATNGKPLRYIDLMGGQKPHLLSKIVNNLGAETHLQYAPSTKFYLLDKVAGKLWITKIPFPVHVVERVEAYDRISRNRFVTRYTYHHGYFDGIEREFRGFGMVEQRDTEEFAALSAGEAPPDATNIDEASHVPPVYTRSWFHTGVYVGRDHISDFFGGLLDAHDRGEYYREPAWRDDDAEARKHLLPDTVMPPELSVEEEREACRALKGMMLRQEVYALDGTGTKDYPHGHPYTVTEQNFTIRVLQPRGGNRHAVFFTHAREAVNYHYERDPADPRIAHAMTLEVDDFGNVLKEAAIGYGRRPTIPVVDEQEQVIEIPNPGLSQLEPQDQAKQTRTLITYTENRVTNAIDDAAVHPDDYRSPLPCEACTYELTGFNPEDNAARFSFDEWTRNGFALPTSAVEIPYEQTADNVLQQKRLIEHVRTLYRRDDLNGVLPLGTLQALALPGESYKLAFTPGLLAQVFQRDGQPLLPNPATVLGGQGANLGGYVVSQDFKAAGAFPNTDPDDHWWIPAGRVFLSPDNAHTAAQERAYAQSHFFLPQRYRDPFQAESAVTFDAYDLLMLETRDALGNRVTVGERLPNGDLEPGKPGNDYRVLQPCRVTDSNRNRSAVAFDALGMVVGTAVMGKPEEALGDSLDGFNADLTGAEILDHLAGPLTDPHAILGRATTRLVYDLFAYQRTEGEPDPQPAVVYTLARATHDADLAPGEQTRVQQSFSYSDGFGREIQKKVQAEPGPVPVRDAEGEIIVGSDGQPVMTESDVSPRWVGRGWTVFNNKGKPVRQYEPFFTDTHQFEFDVRIGVSPMLFYDPVERVVATLHPNHTWEKVVFDPWQQATWDVNDTVLVADPKNDPDVGEFLRRLPDVDYLPTWYARRQGGALGAQEQAAATKAAAYADTPTTAYFDTLGRPFLTVAHNKVVCPNHDLDGTEDKFHTRIELDIEGNQRAVRDAVVQNGDALGRIVMRYDYDMLGNRIHQASMEAGQRWMLNDVAGTPIRAWDSRSHTFRTEYDPLRRPVRSIVTGADPANTNQELLTERLVYGEQHPEAEQHNLRGRLYLHLDQTGAFTAEEQDFKGNPLRASRRIANEYKQAIGWSTVDAALPIDAAATLNPTALEAALAPLLEADAYESSTTYDALNRPATLTTPHTPAMQPSVIRPGYNEANLLDRVDANLRGDAANGQPVWTPFVTNIDYDAKGQRRRIDYGNGTSTFYEYDPLTSRLVHLLTRRDAVAFPDDCPEPPPAGWPGCQAQNLHYTYDPVGNITHIRDDAQQTIYFRNKRVEPSAEYTYDALYRLIEAAGREHLGQIGGAPIPHSHDDAPRVGLLHPGDGNAMGRYIERYVYDAVGNFVEMQNRGSDPNHPGWTRSYAYYEPSLTEPAKTGNRLSSTTVGSNNPPVERCVYDAHGNMTRMPHLGGVHPDPNLRWDYRDLLLQSDLGGGGTAYYIYDAAGQRVRKVWEKSSNLVEERLYLGGFGIFRRRQGTERFERQTLQIMDDQQRIALVETRTLDTAGDDTAPQQLIRYQFGNRLGSASLEMDDQARIISYEEYTPYGSTSYQAASSVTETPKCYRYTGKERDEETGLYYHGARYYAPWLGRWTAADPAGLVDGLGLYTYCRGSPVTLLDPNGQQTKQEPPLTIKSTPEGLKVEPSAALKEISVRVPPGSEERAPSPLKVVGRIERGPAPGSEPLPRGSILVPEAPDQGFAVDIEAVKAAIRENEAAKGAQIVAQREAAAAERERNISKLMGGSGEYLGREPVLELAREAALAKGMGVLLRSGGTGRRLVRGGLRAPTEGAGELDIAVENVSWWRQKLARFKHSEVLRQLESGVDVPAPQGSVSARMLAELTIGGKSSAGAHGVEVALVRLKSGERVLRMGDVSALSTKGVKRVIAHTHPSGKLWFSIAQRTTRTGEVLFIGDVPALQKLGQRSSVLIGPSGKAVRPHLTDPLF